MPKANPFQDEVDEQEHSRPQDITLGDLIWGQQPREPVKWYARFRRYLEQGPNRSLYAVYASEPAKPGSPREKRDDHRPRGGVPGGWRAMASQWNWDERARAYDQFQFERDTIQLAKNREALRAREWDAFVAITGRVDAMLKMPLATSTRETKSADGKTTFVTTVKPTRWSMGDAARLMKVASDIGRLSLGMATSHEVIAVANQGEMLISEADLYRIAAGALNPAQPGKAPMLEAGESVSPGMLSNEQSTDATTRGADTA